MKYNLLSKLPNACVAAQLEGIGTLRLRQCTVVFDLIAHAQPVPLSMTLLPFAAAKHINYGDVAQLDLLDAIRDPVQMGWKAFVTSGELPAILTVAERCSPVFRKVAFEAFRLGIQLAARRSRNIIEALERCARAEAADIDISVTQVLDAVDAFKESIDRQLARLVEQADNYRFEADRLNHG